MLANVPATSVSSCLWQRGLQWLSVFTLKTPKAVFTHCAMQSTKYSLKIRQIYLECNNLEIRDPSKPASASDFWQQMFKLVVDSLRKNSLCVAVMFFNIYAYK